MKLTQKLKTVLSTAGCNPRIQSKEEMKRLAIAALNACKNFRLYFRES
jgi:hypothetical protein